MPEGYRLLDAGYYRLLDGAGPYAWDGTTFALMGSGKSAGAVAPVLAASVAADFSDVFVWGQVTTDTASGTLYAVVVPFAATTPSAAQIVAGTDAAGVAAPAANVAVSSTGVKSVLVQGLTAVTFYKVCFAHQAAGANSGVVTANFTTDTLIFSAATDGTNTGLTGASLGSAPLTAIADPNGGTNALRWVDINDSVTGVMSIVAPSLTYISGENKFHITCKQQGGGQWMRLLPGGITILTASCYWNVMTGAIGTENWTGTPVVFNMGSGWFMLSGSANLAGADVSGNLSLSKTSADNITTITRNGTNIQDIYNLRITRV